MTIFFSARKILPFHIPYLLRVELKRVANVQPGEKFFRARFLYGLRHKGAPPYKSEFFFFLAMSRGQPSGFRNLG